MRQAREKSYENFPDGRLSAVMMTALQEDGRPWPMFNLDVPPEERYNILTAAKLLAITGNHQDDLPKIQNWIRSPSHTRPAETGFNDSFNNFYLHFTASPDGILKYATKLGQVLEDFKRRYPDVAAILAIKNRDYCKEDFEAIKASESFKEAMAGIMNRHPNEDEQWKLQEEGYAKLEKCYADYLAQHPDSPFAKHSDAMNQAYNSMINEYGMIGDFMKG